MKSFWSKHICSTCDVHYREKIVNGIVISSLSRIKLDQIIQSSKLCLPIIYFFLALSNTFPLSFIAQQFIVSITYVWIIINQKNKIKILSLNHQNVSICTTCKKQKHTNMSPHYAITIVNNLVIFFSSFSCVLLLIFGINYYNVFDDRLSFHFCFLLCVCCFSSGG